MASNLIATLRFAMKGKISWGLGFLILLLVAAGCSRGSGEVGEWYSGRVLMINLAVVEKMDKMAYTTLEGKHFVLRPRQPGNELLGAFITVANQFSTRTSMLIDEEAAFIVDRRGNKYPMLNPFDAEEVPTPDPEEGKYGPFLWGGVELNKGYQISGWAFFEVPKNGDLSHLLWEESDTISVHFAD